jgi:Rho-binding antiterminator
MISCPQYDYIEIACLYKFPLEIQLINGTTLIGVAFDTKINQEGQECLILKCEHEEQLVIMKDIKTLKATMNNPHFNVIEFN